MDSLVPRNSVWWLSIAAPARAGKRHGNSRPAEAPAGIAATNLRHGRPDSHSHVESPAARLIQPAGADSGLEVFAFQLQRTAGPGRAESVQPCYHAARRVAHKVPSTVQPVLFTAGVASLEFS
jgi:hypothetical protein